MITIKDIEEVLDEAGRWSDEYGKRHDLQPKHNQIESAAIADAMLAKLVGVEDEGLTEWIDKMTTPVIAELVARSILNGPKGMGRVLTAEFGSLWLTGLTAGILLGRKFPKP